jgi:Bacterial Ig-like domain (group 1)/Bacterial Ig-like domain (group 2)
MSENVPRGRLPVDGRVVKTATSSFAKTVSTLAALVSVLSFARAYGVIGDDAAHLTVGDIGAVWIGISPGADTAEALNDTLQLTATVKDRSGSALVGSSLRWTSDHPEIAAVTQGGEVIAHAPGTTTITATVGGLVARSRIVVRPHVASVRVAGDSDIVMLDGEQRAISARGVDRRGYPIPGLTATWRTTDTTIVAVDSNGVATGMRPGRAVLEVAVSGVRTQAPVKVIPVPYAVKVVSGDNQRAPARGALPFPVVVRVVSRHGLPIPDARVRFRPESGEGSTEPDTTTTDAEGRAKTLWRLGPIPGTRRLLVLVEGIDSALAVTADAEPVAAETRIIGLDTVQLADIGAKLLRPIAIRVTDTAGRPLSDIPVSWVPLDGGTVTPLAPRTDSMGEARVEWTLSNRAGTQRLRAQVGMTRAVPPIVLTAAAKAGAAETAWIVGGNAQTGTVGAPLPKKVAIKALDRAGNVVPNAVVSFAPVRGSVADSAVMADTSGVARAVWTLDREPGPHSMSVRVEGVARPLIVTATARPGAASAIELTPRQAIGTPGKLLSDGVEALVTDEFGNAVKGATVTFKTSSGALSPARVVTDETGRARTKWTLGKDAVEQSLVARVLGSGASATLAARVSLPTKSGTAPTTKPASTKTAAKAPAKPPAKSSSKKKSPR